MGELVNIFSGKELSEDEASRETAEVSAESALAEELGSYIERLDVAEALKTREDDPEAPVQARDLERVELADAKNFSSDVASKVLYEELARAFVPGDEEGTKKRALNNFLQFSDLDRYVVKRAAVALDEPGWSRRTEALYARIREKKVDLLGQAIGPELVDAVRDLDEYLNEGWDSEEWRAELEGRLSGVETQERGAADFLDSVERIGALASEGVGDLKLARDLKGAREAFMKGYPIGRKDPTNALLDSAASWERERQRDLAKKEAAAKAEFLREKVALRLAQRKIEKS